MDDLTRLYTSFDGRINRAAYWLGSLILTVVVITIMVVTGGLIGGVSFMPPSFRFKLISLFLAALFLYPASAMMVKRLHDRDRPPWLAGLFLAPNLIKSLTDVIGVTGNPLAPNLLDMLLGILAFVSGIWVFVELGCLRGTAGTNQYGPDPLGES